LLVQRDGAESALFWLLASIVFVHQPRAAAQSNGIEGLIVREIRVERLQRTERQLVISQLKSSVGEPYSEKNRLLDVEYLDRLWIFSSI